MADRTYVAFREADRTGQNLAVFTIYQGKNLTGAGDPVVITVVRSRRSSLTHSPKTIQQDDRIG
jgi:hypothetical protein